MNTDRLPPHAIEAEQGILGCIMLGGIASLGECQEKFSGNSEVFYDLKHRTVFDAIKTLHDEGVPPDAISLIGKLRTNGRLDQVGGVEYVMSLSDSVPSAANLPHYADEVVAKYTLREIIRRCTDAVGEAFEHSESVVDILDRVEASIMQIRNSVETSGAMRPMKELVKDALDAIERAHQRQSVISGMATGINDLDQMTGGLNPGDMVVIAARPSMGKTSLAIQIAENVAVDRNVPVGVFSLEMSASSLVVRSICSRGKVNARSVAKGFLVESDFPKLTIASGRMRKAPMWIDDTACMTIDTLRAKARRMVQQHGVKLLVVDYIQLIQANRRTPTRQEAVSDISRGIKVLAKELQLPVIALSQISRDLEKDGKRKPRLSDLRESGAIEQDADIVAFLYSPELQKENEPDADAPRPVNLLIAKQRNGPTGDVHLVFLPQYTRFESRSPIDHVDIPIGHND